jgi:hypothetical protein
MRIRGRAGRLTGAVAALALAGAVVAPTTAAADGAADERHVAYTGWSGAQLGNTGSHDGTRPAPQGGLTIDEPVGTREYTDPFGDGDAKRYDYARWTSPTVQPGFDLEELIASWNARTPGGSWVEIEMRGTADDGSTSDWYVLGRWAETDEHLHRTSAGWQSDDLGYVAIDTFVAREGRSLSDWQLRITLLRPEGTGVRPVLDNVGAMASKLPADGSVDEASPSGGAEGIVLDVPAYSQQVHRGHYEEWGGGGQAWCSPTSTSMVLRYWGTGPGPQDYRWVRPREDAWVDHAARGTFDYNYDGAGNWPFNTAYAGRYGVESFVTRLRSLTEAEQFIKAGIPLVVSMAFEEDELDGAGYGTNGHLMVIVGFDEDGDVVVNDPASHLIPDNDEVRFTYDRQQFEDAWIGHSGGVTYVTHPASVPLPPSPEQANW